MSNDPYTIFILLMGIAEDYLSNCDRVSSGQGMGIWLALVWLLPLQLTSHVILDNMFNLWLNKKEFF